MKIKCTALTFREWKEEYFHPSEELIKDLTSLYKLDLIEELNSILKEKFDHYEKTGE